MTNIADILCQSQTSTSVVGGVRSEWKLQLSGKAVKSKGAWKIKNSKATTY